MNRLNLKRKILQNRYIMLMTIIILMIIIFSSVGDSFLTFSTAMNILRQTSALAIAAVGMTMIILTGGIDLSPGAVVAFAGAVGAWTMQQLGFGVGMTAIIGVLATLFAAVLIGLLNGIMIGRFNISPFMTTLATMSIARGLTLKITQSSRIMVDNGLYNWIGQAKLFSIGRTNIPAVILLLVLVYAISLFIMSKTTFGRKIYAIGGNPVASRASGVKVIKQIILVYIFAAVFYGLASIITVGRAMSAQPLAGLGFEFEVITAVVIGGTSLSGGVGNLKGTLLGALLVGIISTGLGMVNVPPYTNYIVKGLLILGAVLLDIYSSSDSRNLQSDENKTAHIGKNNNKALLSITENKQDTLKLKNITKTFPSVRALDEVSLEVKRGKVHALVGENGAGKSTLMKILSGVYNKDEGEIYIDDNWVDVRNPIESRKLGISVIYQELELVPELSVTQNIYLGKEINKKNLLLDTSKMNKRSKELLERFNININVKRRVDDYTVAQMQMIEIAKAIDSNAWVVVMDEPTASITEREKEKLFEIINELKESGIAIIYISHRMAEIFEIADEVTVLRDGKHVITKPIEDVTENDLVKYMVGRELSDIYEREKRDLIDDKEVVLEVKNLYKKGVFEPISFKVRKGEILGFSGLVGAGRTEIMRCIVGLDKPDSGELILNGKLVNIKNPQIASKEGICLVSEDRRREGIVETMSVRENISLPSLNEISSYSVINIDKEKEIANQYINLLNIKTPNDEQKIGKLSGGNQQKCCLAKWLAKNPDVIILDEPTRGIDVGAKSEIHKLIDRLIKNDIAIILISSELPEIIGASDNIVVLYEGVVTGRFSQKKDIINQENLMRCASGIVKNDNEVENKNELGK